MPESKISRSNLALTISLTNLMRYISLMSPLLITFFMIMISIFNNTLVKGLIFTFGIIIVTFISYILKNTIRSTQDVYAAPTCNILPSPFSASGSGNYYSSPNLSSCIIGYTLSYLVLPMQLNNQLNPSLLTFLVAVLGINGTVEIHDKCTSIGGVILGAIVGIIFGLLYYSIISMSGHKDLAYFSETLSNDIKCSKPTQQNFKCRTYYRSSKPKIK